MPTRAQPHHTQHIMHTLAQIICLATALVLSIAGDASFWRKQRIYQVLTDRFAVDGTGMPCPNLQQYCGGTWRGITSKLGFIQDLGFTAIWISPIPKNMPDGYHGYWFQDLALLNEHFGSAEDLAGLVQAAHARGIAVMLDVVANHPGGTGSTISQIQPFNDSAYYHNCTGCCSGCTICDWSLSAASQAQIRHCRLAGLPDLNQSIPFVADTLTTWVQTMVQTYGFDGLRVDTTPEVPREFWRTFDAAAGVFAMGEVDTDNVQFTASYQGTAHPGVLSYPLFHTLRDVFAFGNSAYGLQSALQAYQAAFPDLSLLGTFIDNHDNPRFLNQNADQTAYANAITYVLTAQGIPIIYYGTAVAFNGGNDPDCREPLWSSPQAYQVQGVPLAELIQTLNRLASNLTSDVSQVQRYADDQFYAYTRGDTAAAMFVALTNVGSAGSPVSRTITYHPYPDGTVLCNGLADTPVPALRGVPDSSAGRTPSAVFATLAGLHTPAAATDCVTVTNSRFMVTLLNGEAKVYLPQ